MAKHQFNPPAGTVEVAGDPSWSWDGHHWHMNGHRQNPPDGALLQGKPGSSFAGWSYDWHTHAWESPAQLALASGASSAPANIHVSVPPQQMPHVEHHHHEGERMHHDCQHDHKKEKPGLLKALAEHPVLPILGVAALIIPQFVKSPTAPPIDQNTPPWLAAYWQTIYDANRDKYRDTRETWNNVGQGLLQFGTAQQSISQNDFEQINKLVSMISSRRAA
jgi:hypothetical protein